MEGVEFELHLTGLGKFGRRTGKRRGFEGIVRGGGVNRNTKGAAGEVCVNTIRNSFSGICVMYGDKAV